MPPAPAAAPPDRESRATDHKFITRTPGIKGGEPTVAGTRVGVRDVVCTLRLGGHTPETLAAEAFPHLTLAQVYDALSYYHDHRAEMDEVIARKEPRDPDAGPRSPVAAAR